MLHSRSHPSSHSSYTNSHVLPTSYSTNHHTMSPPPLLASNPSSSSPFSPHIIQNLLCDGGPHPSTLASHAEKAQLALSTSLCPSLPENFTDNDSGNPNLVAYHEDALPVRLPSLDDIVAGVKWKGWVGMVCMFISALYLGLDERGKYVWRLMWRIRRYFYVTRRRER